MTASEKILKEHHLRVTPFRAEVLQIFTNAGKALSSHDIESQLSDADRITLYRTLKSFEEKGIIHKAIDGTITQKYALCDAHCDEDHHHDEHVHFHCEKCENTFCLDQVVVPNIELPSGFKVKHTNMVVNGVCKDCCN
ncbi:MAG: transcriptional repressor [Saprospiraceae bacterium]|jgi:Fur family ferric uptake transcriptional regulator|nr:transcriptional repressor [Saprospiraceae bacterium]